MGTRKRIRTVLYGDQRLTSAELEVLHTPAMQRLYGLRQLGLADRVFIDASHARIHHVVGVLQQIDKLVFAIISNLRRSTRMLSVGTATNTQAFPASRLAMIVRRRRPVIRFIGLLHDLTHAPFGHTVEDEIGLVETRHDEPARQAYAFYRLLCQLIAWLGAEADASLPDSLRPFLSQTATGQQPNPEEVGEVARHLVTGVDPSKAKLCWRLSQRELAETLAQLGCAMTALTHLEALHKMELQESDLPSKSEYTFQTAVREALKGTAFEPLLDTFQFDPNRDAFMLDLVGNTVCADLLDYARRDSHFAGLRLDYDSDRIAENFTLVSLDAAAYEVNHPHRDGTGKLTGRSVPPGYADPFEGWCLRTAISLVSHKYRTDVPSELMNLLNVRFYLYERAVYHPTKCAADSMLGTALQLLGWRELDNGQRPVLPEHLRFVGDEVFLHDIRSALGFVVGWLSKLSDTVVIDEGHLHSVTALDSVHSGLVPMLVRIRLGSTVKEAQEDLKAAQLLLDRLAARRYFRPVFRALPNSVDARLQAGPEELAKFFLKPDTRYEAERQIELACQLPRGTVTIHCPARKTAKKVANVLLTKPGQSVDEVRKLQDIGSLDPTIFGEHEKAVKAVEEMYGSMWRLAVYVAPEHLPEHEKISRAAGRVIFKTIDVHRHYADDDSEWPNDRTLEDELMQRLPQLRDAQDPDVMELSPLGELLGRIGDQLLESGRIGELPDEVLARDMSSELRARLEEALLNAFRQQTAGEKKPNVDQERMDQLVGVLKTYKAKPTREELRALTKRFSRRLAVLESEKFAGFVSQIEAAVRETQFIDKQALVHKGHKFDTFSDLVDELLRERERGPSLPLGEKGSEPGEKT